MATSETPTANRRPACCQFASWQIAKPQAGQRGASQRLWDGLEVGPKRQFRCWNNSLRMPCGRDGYKWEPDKPDVARGKAIKVMLAAHMQRGERW